MANLNDQAREELLSVLDCAQQRLDTLRDTVRTAKGTLADSDIRIAIGDALTPLNIAFELMEAL
ncbi:hypothetical protein APB19_09650 [Pseudomonas aeruginosa]|nr:hypothetical protein APB19_09650 [Pseudomonas aeruginosa]